MHGLVRRLLGDASRASTIRARWACFKRNYWHIPTEVSLVEHSASAKMPSKQDVAGSNPVPRSNFAYPL